MTGQALHFPKFKAENCRGIKTTPTSRFAPQVPHLLLNCCEFQLLAQSFRDLGVQSGQN